MFKYDDTLVAIKNPLKSYKDDTFEIGQIYTIDEIYKNFIKVINSQGVYLREWYSYECFELLSIKREEIINDILK